jgi:hypothetical protein
MSAAISKTFDIVVDQTITSGSTLTITNPGRTFTVLQILVTGLNTATPTIRKNDNSGTIVNEIRALATARGLTEDPQDVLTASAQDVFDTSYIQMCFW